MCSIIRHRVKEAKHEQVKHSQSRKRTDATVLENRNVFVRSEWYPLQSWGKKATECIHRGSLLLFARSETYSSSFSRSYKKKRRGWKIKLKGNKCSLLLSITGLPLRRSINVAGTRQDKFTRFRDRRTLNESGFVRTRFAPLARIIPE